jgi:dTDP-4-amino-4,6-dideoxygalactose transaminase
MEGGGEMIPSWDVVEQFERRMAAWCGAPYAVACDTCTAALFLCLKAANPRIVTIPGKTYLGVACSVIHSGAELVFREDNWTGCCSLTMPGSRYFLIDSACRLKKGMYRQTWGAMVCLSFQYRKHLKIGRGGMILTDNEDHATWFRKARFCGRAEHNGVPEFIGYHCFMEPERAARGLVLMDSLDPDPPDLEFSYPDISEYEVLR